MLTATARSIPGSLRQEVLIDDQHLLFTDEPEPVGGAGSAPAPHELVAAALAACHTTTLVMYARNRGLELGEVKATVAYDQKATPRRAVITVEIEADIDDETRERLEKVAAACPVAKALQAGIAIEETLTVRGAERGSGATV